MQDKFAGGDPDYVRTDQYGTTDKLQARANLHTRYSTAEAPWFEWLVAQVLWRPGQVVEVGCGTGAMWAEGRPPVDGPIQLSDLSQGMVEAATTRATAAGYTVEGRVAAAQELPVADRAVAHAISNHMLYHVPHPPDAVREFARILADDGLLTVATNGERHMLTLKEIEHSVFATRVVDRTIEAFGLTTGLPMLNAEFEDVEMRPYTDSLHITSRDDVLAYMTSYPPMEGGTPQQLAALEVAVDAAFEAGDGTLVVEKDVGLFLCRGPRR